MSTTSGLIRRQYLARPEGDGDLRPPRHAWGREERRAWPSPAAHRLVAGREKGLDLALALDLQALATEGAKDVAIIVSGDTDFCEVASRVPAATQGAVAVEAAQFTASGRGRCLEAYRRTHHLGPEDFAAVRDDFDYRRARSTTTTPSEARAALRLATMAARSGKAPRSGMSA